MERHAHRRPLSCTAPQQVEPAPHKTAGKRPRAQLTYRSCHSPSCNGTQPPSRELQACKARIPSKPRVQGQLHSSHAVEPIQSTAAITLTQASAVRQHNGSPLTVDRARPGHRGASKGGCSPLPPFCAQPAGRTQTHGSALPCRHSMEGSTPSTLKVVKEDTVIAIAHGAASLRPSLYAAITPQHYVSVCCGAEAHTVRWREGRRVAWK